MHNREESKKYSGGCESIILGPILLKLYGILKPMLFKDLIVKMVLKLEKGELYSITLRKIFKKYYYLNVGLYSGGGCFVPNNFTHKPPGTTIGRYCEIAYSMRAFNANHPMNMKSMHAIFFNPGYGFSKKDLLQRSKLTIGNDVWIGHNAIILPTVNTIGDGAVIGANSVVNQDVPPYAVVSGFPARIIRYRFTEKKKAELIQSAWWEKSIEELLPEFESFQKPFDVAEDVR
jgi:acetyltransferase-like isoleucine patch superfamily enzyme